MELYIEDIGNYSHILLIHIQYELDNDMKNQIIEKILYCHFKLQNH